MVIFGRSTSPEVETKMDVNSLLEKANARATTLNNLKKAYGGVASSNKTTSSTQKDHPELVESSASNSNVIANKQSAAPVSDKKRQDSLANSYNNHASNLSARARSALALDTLLSAVSLSDARSRRFFSDQLDGKSVILTNTAKRARAASASSRGKAHLRRKKRAGKSSLESAGLLNPYAVPTAADILSAYDLWLNFIWGVIDSCSNEAQLQARLNSAGLLGARVCVHGARSHHVGRSSVSNELVGYVCNESQNCIYVAVICDVEAKADSCSAPPGVHGAAVTNVNSLLTTDEHNQQNGASGSVIQSLPRVQVHRVLRAYSDIVVKLPARADSTDKERFCIFKRWVT